MAVLFTALLLAAQVAATPRLQPGAMTERVACPSDPTQTYTLYLPSAYDSNRIWPVLFVFDPRGRGTAAATIFRDAAERFGWIIASSNNTMSDGPWEPNRRALDAMWPDVLRGYAVDPKRIYGAGFSGGATVAFVLARAGGLAGVIAAGAPDRPHEGVAPPKIAWFGSAGDLDFNFLEARLTDARMAKAGNRHRLEFFDGAHQWLKPDGAMRAIAWLEAVAMKEGRRPVDAELARRIAADDLAYARALESQGRLTQARDVYASIVDTYTGLTDVGDAAARAAELDRGDALRDARRDEKRTDDREQQRTVQAMTTLALLHDPEQPLAGRLRQELGMDGLKKTARGDGYQARSAARVLEVIFVHTSFYIRRELEERKDFDRAATSLEIAVDIHGDRPRLWLDLAANHARSNRRKPALAALERAVSLGYANRAELEADARFTSIARTSEFAALLDRMKAPRD